MKNLLTFYIKPCIIKEQSAQFTEILSDYFSNTARFGQRFPYRERWMREKKGGSVYFYKFRAFAGRIGCWGLV